MSLLNIFAKKTDKKNINLLPSESVEVVSKKDLTFTILIPIITAALIIASFGGLLLLEKIESTRSGVINKQISDKEAEWKNYATVSANLNQVRTNLAMYEQESLKNKNLYQNLIAIRDVIPTSLNLTRLDFKLNNANLDGTAADPRSVYQFVEVLKSKPTVYSKVTVKNINYQASEGKYNFSVSFSIANQTK
jgi:Tfp pilus assembly protein PilN